MRFRDGSVITKTDPHRHKFGDALAELLDHLGPDYEDESSGDVDCLTDYFQRFGRRILFTDDRGFVWIETYPTEDDAEEMFVALANYYSIWGDEEYDEDARLQALDAAAVRIYEVNQQASR